jgi:sigma-E factor negative regulatory protein RseC
VSCPTCGRTEIPLIELAESVENMMGDSVQVRIVQTSACAACKVAGYCNASESKEKLVDIYHADTRNLKVGDVVTVTASTQVAAQALLLGFGLPFVVLVAVLIAVLLITGNEGAAALSGLAALVPYYAVLFLFRNRIRDKLSFSIE